MLDAAERSNLDSAQILQDLGKFQPYRPIAAKLSHLQRIWQDGRAVFHGRCCGLSGMLPPLVQSIQDPRCASVNLCQSRASQKIEFFQTRQLRKRRLIRKTPAPSPRLLCGREDWVRFAKEMWPPAPTASAQLGCFVDSSCCCVPAAQKKIDGAIYIFSILHTPGHRPSYRSLRRTASGSAIGI